MKLAVRQFSREEVRTVFAKRAAATRYEIARTIARQFRKFEPILPPPRKIWNSEDPRLSIFDAVSLIATFFRTEMKVDAVQRGEATR